MRKLFFISILMFLNISFAQESKELKVSLKRAIYDNNRFGGSEKEYGPDIKNTEILYNTYFYLEIIGYGINNPIDFNNFSIVEDDLKLRQRAFSAGFDNFNDWVVNKVDLKNFQGEDVFLKYSQDGVINNDHYYIRYEAFKWLEPIQQRFCLLWLDPKKNKDNEFILSFPVKSKKSGNFSLYYKDILLKKIYLERGKPLKFKIE